MNSNKCSEWTAGLLPGRRTPPDWFTRLQNGTLFCKSPPSWPHPNTQRSACSSTGRYAKPPRVAFFDWNSTHAMWPSTQDTRVVGMAFSRNGDHTGSEDTPTLTILVVMMKDQGCIQSVELELPLPPWAGITCVCLISPGSNYNKEC